MKEIEDNINRWKVISCSWIGRINIVKMTILPEEIYRFNAIPIKIPNGIFHRTRANNSKMYIETPKTWIAKTNLRKKNRAGGIILPDFRLYCKAAVIKTIWNWHKKWHLGQWKRIESLETNPCTYGQLIYDKGGKNIQWRKDSFFNNWCWENWTAMCKKWN